MVLFSAHFLKVSLSLVHNLIYFCIHLFNCNLDTISIKSQSRVNKTNGQEKFALRWSKFETAAMETYKSLHSDMNFTDVTLVCDDNQQVEAHTIILSSASPFFKSILPFIYISFYIPKRTKAGST